MSQRSSSVRFYFQYSTPLGPDHMEPLLRELTAGLPLPPDEVEASPDGSGSVLYGEDESLTLDDLTAVGMWLREHPRLSDVRLEAAIDVPAG
jgi:hypothetical protein